MTTSILFCRLLKQQPAKLMNIWLGKKSTAERGITLSRSESVMTQPVAYRGQKNALMIGYLIRFWMKAKTITCSTKRFVINLFANLINDISFIFNAIKMSKKYLLTNLKRAFIALQTPWLLAYNA